MTRRCSRWRWVAYAFGSMFLIGACLAGCEGRCVGLNEDIGVNTLSYRFSECTRGASDRGVVCQRNGQTSTFSCTCTEGGAETASFETQGPPVGVMSNMSVSYETLNQGCGWTDIRPFRSR